MAKTGWEKSEAAKDNARRGWPFAVPPVALTEWRPLPG
jgi:hypothetical protein